MANSMAIKRLIEIDGVGILIKEAIEMRKKGGPIREQGQAYARDRVDKFHPPGYGVAPLPHRAILT